MPAGVCPSIRFDAAYQVVLRHDVGHVVEDIRLEVDVCAGETLNARLAGTHALHVMPRPAHRNASFAARPLPEWSAMVFEWHEGGVRVSIDVDFRE